MDGIQLFNINFVSLSKVVTKFLFINNDKSVSVISYQSFTCPLFGNSFNDCL